MLNLHGSMDNYRLVYDIILFIQVCLFYLHNYILLVVLVYFVIILLTFYKFFFLCYVTGGQLFYNWSVSKNWFVSFNPLVNVLYTRING